MTDSRWWRYTQRLIAGDTAQAAAARAGFNKSAFSRWKRGAHPEPAVVVKLARAYGGSVLEALVESELITAREARLRTVTLGKTEALGTLTDIELAEEILRRVSRRPAPTLEAPLDDEHPAMDTLSETDASEEADDEALDTTVLHGRFVGGGGTEAFAEDAAALNPSTSIYDEAEHLEKQP